jgi:DNA-directed RNA polymerase subunit M/transcription elongation factor TFIIS
MAEPRLGDDIDDFCIKCKRLSNHLIVSLMNSAAAKVRCRSCYSEHDFRKEQAPPTKKELKKQALLAAEAIADEKTAEPQA